MKTLFENERNKHNKNNWRNKENETGIFVFIGQKSSRIYYRFIIIKETLNSNSDREKEIENVHLFSRIVTLSPAVWKLSRL